MTTAALIAGKITSPLLSLALEPLGDMPVILRVADGADGIDVPLDAGRTGIHLKHGQATDHGDMDLVRILVDASDLLGHQITAAELADRIGGTDHHVKVVLYDADMSFLMDGETTVDVEQIDGRSMCVITTTDTQDA